MACDKANHALSDAFDAPWDHFRYTMRRLTSCSPHHCLAHVRSSSLSLQRAYVGSQGF